jgi:hypothetical protein
MPAQKLLDLNEIRSRIQPMKFAKQGFPKPKRVSLIEGTDSDGERAFHVYVVFPDNTPDEALAWKKIEPMVSWVRNLVWEATGKEFWPYVNVKREKEILAKLG